MDRSYASVLESYLINDLPAMESASDIVKFIRQGIQAAFKKIKEFFRQLKQKILDKIRKSKQYSRTKSAAKPNDKTKLLTKQAIDLLQKIIDDIKMCTDTIWFGAQKIPYGSSDADKVRTALEDFDAKTNKAISDMIDRIDHTIDIFNEKYKGRVDNDELYDGILNWINICMSNIDIADRKMSEAIRWIETLSNTPGDIKLIGTKISANIAKYGAALTKLDNLIQALI